MSYFFPHNSETCTVFISFLLCVFHRLARHLRHEVLPVKHVLETNLLRLVEEKWEVASSMVKPIFQHEFSLSKHFQIMRGIFLMEAGDIMRHFYTSLFKQVTCLVSVFIYFPNGRYIDYLSLTYATNKNDTLKLHYKYCKYYKQHSK